MGHQEDQFPLAQMVHQVLELSPKAKRDSPEALLLALSLALWPVLALQQPPSGNSASTRQREETLPLEETEGRRLQHPP